MADNSNSTGWLQSLLNNASQVATSYLAPKPANTPATPTAKPVDWVKIATFAGVGIGVLALLFVILKRK